MPKRPRTHTALLAPIPTATLSVAGVLGAQVRLQHPLGVEVVAGALFVADTYIHKIKRLDPVSGEVVTVAGGERDGWRDGAGSEALPDEPGGLSVPRTSCTVADTNNRAVRVFDPARGKLETLRLRDPLGLPAPDAPLLGEVLRLPPVTVSPGSGTLDVESDLPELYILNDLAPLTVSLQTAEDRVRLGSSEFAEDVPELPIRFDAELVEGDECGCDVRRGGVSGEGVD